MEISFKISDFEKDKHGLYHILIQLKYKNLFERTNELDDFFSKQPALAYKYIRNLIIERSWCSEEKLFKYKNKEKNRFSPDQEKVFSKNIKYALAYLEVTGQKKFRDEKFNNRFEKKVFKCPRLSFNYAQRILKGRIPEENEIIFVNDCEILYHYANLIIGGRFSPSIDKILMLKSFENNNHSAGSYAHSTAVKDSRFLACYLNNDKSLVDKHFRKYRV